MKSTLVSCPTYRADKAVLRTKAFIKRCIGSGLFETFKLSRLYSDCYHEFNAFYLEEQVPESLNTDDEKTSCGDLRCSIRPKPSISRPETTTAMIRKDDHYLHSLFGILQWSPASVLRNLARTSWYPPLISAVLPASSLAYSPRKSLTVQDMLRPTHSTYDAHAHAHRSSHPPPVH